VFGEIADNPQTQGVVKEKTLKIFRDDLNKMPPLP